MTTEMKKINVSTMYPYKHITFNCVSDSISTPTTNAFSYYCQPTRPNCCLINSNFIHKWKFLFKQGGAVNMITLYVLQQEL